MKQDRTRRQAPDCAYGYSHVYRKRRSKTDWAGIGIGEAYKVNIDYHLRLQAQRLFHLVVKKAQAEAVRMTGGSVGAEFEPRIKPQLGPCYTTYPSTLSAYAAIGLTAFLEFEAWAGEKPLFIYLRDYLNDPAKADKVQAEPEIYKKVVRIVVQCIHTRLLLESLTRQNTLSAIELYRLFSASQQNMRFGSLAEIINSVILYGDIMPDWREMNLHPLTYSILSELSAVCSPFFDRLSAASEFELINLGMEWVRAICPRISVYLPRPKKSGAEKETEAHGDNRAKNLMQQLAEFLGTKHLRFSEEQSDRAHMDQIAPLNGPNPPALFDSADPTEEDVMKSLMNEEDEEEQRETLDNFSTTIENAVRQDQTWEDMRSDILERVLGKTAFHEGPIEGNPAEGHVVNANLGGGLEAGGLIFDRCLELSDDLPAMEKLLEESKPVKESLRRILYPNIRQVPETQHLRTGGSLDPARLAIAEFSTVIFKRSLIREKPDRRGRPVLVIACDGSGSLDTDQMKMVKILASGWLNSTVKSDVQVLAGLYHSDQIREGMSGPLVQWIYHPHKTPVISRRDATLCLVGLPDSGTGVQSDALSLDYMVEEADRLAKGNMIYLTVLSDTEWNRSYHTEKEGKEEVCLFFKNAYERFSGRVHVTLVALGVSEDTGFEGLVDKVITVSHEELENSGVVAEKVGVYVASCMRERKKMMKNTG